MRGSFLAVHECTTFTRCDFFSYPLRQARKSRRDPGAHHLTRRSPNPFGQTTPSPVRLPYHQSVATFKPSTSHDPPGRMSSALWGWVSCRWPRIAPRTVRRRMETGSEEDDGSPLASSHSGVTWNKTPLIRGETNRGAPRAIGSGVKGISCGKNTSINVRKFPRRYITSLVSGPFTKSLVGGRSVVVSLGQTGSGGLGLGLRCGIGCVE